MLPPKPPMENACPEPPARWTGVAVGLTAALMARGGVGSSRAAAVAVWRSRAGGYAACAAVDRAVRRAQAQFYLALQLSGTFSSCVVVPGLAPGRLAPLAQSGLRMRNGRRAATSPEQRLVPARGGLPSSSLH